MSNIRMNSELRNKILNRYRDSADHIQVKMLQTCRTLKQKYGEPLRRCCKR